MAANRLNYDWEWRSERGGGGEQFNLGLADPPEVLELLEDLVLLLPDTAELLADLLLLIKEGLALGATGGGGVSIINPGLEAFLKKEEKKEKKN